MALPCIQTRPRRNESKPGSKRGDSGLIMRSARTKMPVLRPDQHIGRDQYARKS